LFTIVPRFADAATSASTLTRPKSPRHFAHDLKEVSSPNAAVAVFRCIFLRHYWYRESNSSRSFQQVLLWRTPRLLPILCPSFCSGMLRHYVGDDRTGEAVISLWLHASRSPPNGIFLMILETLTTAIVEDVLRLKYHVYAPTVTYPLISAPRRALRSCIDELFATVRVGAVSSAVARRRFVWDRTDSGLFTLNLNPKRSEEPVPLLYTFAITIRSVGSLAVTLHAVFVSSAVHECLMGNRYIDATKEQVVVAVAGAKSQLYIPFRNIDVTEEILSR